MSAAATATARLRHPDFIVLALYWVAIGYLWQSLGTLILPDLVRELVGQANQGKALSLLEGIGTVMAIVRQPMMGAVSDRTHSRFGRRHPYILGGTLGDLVCLLGLALSGSYWWVVVFYFLLQATFTTPLAHPDFLWLMSSRLLILMGIVGIQSFVLFFFADTFFRGDSRATTTATTSLVGLVVGLAILVTWPAAWLSDRIGRKPLIVIGGLTATAGMMVMVFAGYRWLPDVLISPLAASLSLPELAAQTLVAGALLGIGFGSFISVDWAFITDVIPRDQAGLFFGFSNIATAGSGVIARLFAGVLLDHFNAGPPLLNLPGGYPVVFGVFVAWLVAGTLLILKVRGGGRAGEGAR